MAELPVHPTDAAICRLLAGGPLPTAAIAARLAIPERTARHRLRRLRRAGTVVTCTGGLHRLAGSVPTLAGATAGLAAAGDGPAEALAAATPAAIAPGSKETDGTNRGLTTLPGSHWTALAVLAVAGIGIAAVTIRRQPPDPSSPQMADPGDWPPSWW